MSGQKLSAIAGTLVKPQTPSFNDPKFAISETPAGMFVISRLAAAPGTAAVGDTYLATATAGTWTVNRVYVCKSLGPIVWSEVIPVAKNVIWVNAEHRNYIFNGTAWVASTSMEIIEQPVTSAAGISSPVYNISKEGIGTGGYDTKFNVF